MIHLCQVIVVFWFIASFIIWCVSGIYLALGEDDKDSIDSLNDCVWTLMHHQGFAQSVFIAENAYYLLGEFAFNAFILRLFVRALLLVKPSPLPSTERHPLCTLLYKTQLLEQRERNKPKQKRSSASSIIHQHTKSHGSSAADGLSKFVSAQQKLQAKRRGKKRVSNSLQVRGAALPGVRGGNRGKAKPAATPVSTGSQMNTPIPNEGPGPAPLPDKDKGKGKEKEEAQNFRMGALLGGLGLNTIDSSREASISRGKKTKTHLESSPKPITRSKGSGSQSSDHNVSSTEERREREERAGSASSGAESESGTGTATQTSVRKTSTDRSVGVPHGVHPISVASRSQASPEPPLPSDHVGPRTPSTSPHPPLEPPNFNAVGHAPANSANLTIKRPSVSTSVQHGRMPSISLQNSKILNFEDENNKYYIDLAVKSTFLILLTLFSSWIANGLSWVFLWTYPLDGLINWFSFLSLFLV